MKICPKCGNYHSKSGMFCSRSCANSRTVTAESNLKRSKALKGKRSNRGPIDVDAWRVKVQETAYKKYLATPFSDLGLINKKRRIVDEQQGKCNHCGIDSWSGQPIVLELEHKDGNNQNHSRENLECICPNCHSLTKTWRGRNNKTTPVPDSVLLEALKSYNKISEALRSLGLADKGKNYERAKRLLGIQ